MHGTSSSPRSFGSKLDAELLGRGLTKRALARMISARTGQDIETARRAIYKWIVEGVEPTAESRAVVTDALEMERGALDSDEEESRMYVHLVAQLREALSNDAVLAELGLRRAA
jgi:hypothetical protein